MFVFQTVGVGTLGQSWLYVIWEAGIICDLNLIMLVFQVPEIVVNIFPRPESP